MINVGLCRSIVAKRCAHFINHCGYHDIGLLHLKTAFCTVAFMTVYTALYLLVLAESGTAGVKEKVFRRRGKLRIRHFMISINVLTVRPMYSSARATESNYVHEQRTSRPWTSI